MWTNYPFTASISSLFCCYYGYDAQVLCSGWAQRSASVDTPLFYYRVEIAQLIYYEVNYDGCDSKDVIKVQVPVRLKDTSRYVVAPTTEHPAAYVLRLRSHLVFVTLSSDNTADSIAGRSAYQAYLYTRTVSSHFVRLINATARIIWAPSVCLTSLSILHTDMRFSVRAKSNDEWNMSLPTPLQCRIHLFYCRYLSTVGVVWSVKCNTRVGSVLIALAMNACLSFILTPSISKSACHKACVLIWVK